MSHHSERENGRSASDLDPSRSASTIGTMRGLRRLWCDEAAATAVEYAIIVAAIAGLVVVVAFALGKKAHKLINNTTSAMP